MTDTNKTDAKAPRASASDRTALAQIIADRVLVALVLLAGSILGGMGDDAHAGMLIAGGLGWLGGMHRGATASAAARAIPLALGIGAASILSGCAGTSAGAVARVTCHVVQRAADACELAGLAPSAPCPFAFDAD